MSEQSFIKGDTFEIIKQMRSESVDLIHTDPPYGTDPTGRGYGKTRDKSRPHATRERRTIRNNDNLKWLPEIASELYRILKDDKFCVVWGSWRTSDIVRAIFRDSGFTEHTKGIWNKEVQGLGSGFADTYEEWMVFRKGDARANYHAKNVISEVRICGTRPDHPHAKPKSVVKKIISNLSSTNDLVFDPFAGTGVTAIACLELSRQYKCIEIEEEHVNKALSKIKAYHEMQRFEFSTREG